MGWGAWDPVAFPGPRSDPSPLDELTCSARLTVRPSLAPLFTRLLEDMEVLEGRAARFDCKISGTPPPAVTWTHFGMVLCPADVGGPPRALGPGSLTEPTPNAHPFLLQATRWRRVRTCGSGRKEVCTLCTSPTWAVRTRGCMQSALPTPTARPSAQPSSMWRSLGRLPPAPGTAGLPGGDPRPPLCCLHPVVGGAALGIWADASFLQLEAGEDAIYPRGAGAGRAGAAVHT